MTIDVTTIVQAGQGLLVSVIGWFLNELWHECKDLRRELAELKVTLARDYVPWDRLAKALEPIHDALERIFGKLDTKVDKD